MAGNRGAVIALGVLSFLVLVAAVGPLFTPADPNAQNLRAVLLDPLSPGHLLGTDQLGRDLLARLGLGTAVSLAIVLSASVISVVVAPSTAASSSAW